MSTVLNDDDITQSGQGEALSSRANKNVDAATAASTTTTTVSGGNSLNRSSHKTSRWKPMPRDSENYLCKSHDTGGDLSSPSDKQTADAQKQSDKARQSLPHQMNGFVSTANSAVCDYGSSKLSIVR